MQIVEKIKKLIEQQLFECVVFNPFAKKFWFDYFWIKKYRDFIYHGFCKMMAKDFDDVWWVETTIE